MNSMKLTDTDIIHKGTIRVKDNVIYDYSQDGNYPYCLHIYDKNPKRSPNGYFLIAAICFGTNMSPELYDCIRDTVVFDSNGNECRIDECDCDYDVPLIVCDHAGRPKLQKGITTRIFKSMMCEYIRNQMGLHIDEDSINVFATFGYMQNRYGGSMTMTKIIYR